MLVLALPDQQLVADDVGPEHGAILGRLLGPALELFETANVFAVDEHLRHGAAAGDRADDARALAVIEGHLAVLIAELREQLLRTRAIAAALARENRDLVRLLRPRVDVIEHGV